MLSKTSYLKIRLWFAEHAQQVTLVVSLALVALLNIQLLWTAFFHEDDFFHFYQIASWRPLDFIFFSIGGHLYIFRNFVLFILFKLFGLNATAFFSVILITHLGNACLLYKIIHLITGKTMLAAAGAIMWGICPANYETMAWCSAHGHILVIFFFLLFLHNLLKLEKGKISFSSGITIRWSVYILLMACSYGNGVILAFLAPVIIVIILWKNENKWRIAASLLPVLALLFFLLVFNDSIYSFFSGEAPLYIQDRVVKNALNHKKNILELFAWLYANSIYWVTLPYAIPATCVAMLKYSMLFNRCAYLFPQVLVVGMITVGFFVLLVRASNEKLRYYAAFCLLAVGLLGVIAYGRASMVGGFPMHWAALTLRWYYAILVVVTLIMALLAAQALDLYPKFSKVLAAHVFMAVIVTLFLYHNYSTVVFYNLNKPASINAKKIYYDTVREIEKTVRASPHGSNVYIDNKMKQRIDMIFRDKDFPGKAAVFAITYPTNMLEGRRVYFVENDCLLAQKYLAKKDWRISTLIVSGCAQEK